MANVFVQFESADEASIISVFGCAQDPDIWPNQGEITNDDPRYLAFLDPPLTPAQAATAALEDGLSVTSTGTPALNGTYACDQLSQMDVIAIETSLNAGKGFPGGATTFNYPDMSGVPHTFSEVNFTNFAAAIRDYVYQLKSVIAGASTALPAATSTIG